MRADTALRVDAMDLLVKGLGEVEAERFIFLVKSDTFDYTEWQRDLWKDKTLEELFEDASAYSKNES